MMISMGNVYSECWVELFLGRNGRLDLHVYFLGEIFSFG
jgi:hypothetical protein